MDKARYAVTVGRNCGDAYIEQAKEWARELQINYFDRPQNRKLEEYLQEQGLETAIIATSKGPKIFNGETEFHYHPGMAVLRLQQLKKGEGDHFCEAMALKKGARVLDCTLGLASDAAIASYCVGPEGSVTGLEASELLYFAVNYGLKNFEAEDPELTEALRRIKVVPIIAHQYLKALVDEERQEDSFEVIYFDPMFRRPVKGSVAMDALRPLSYEAPLEKETVALALKLAPRVVIKERNIEWLKSLGCQEILGGRYAKVKYGVIRR